MNVPCTNFTIAGNLDELKAKGRIVLHDAHRPILVVYDRGRVFALDNRCPARRPSGRRASPRPVARLDPLTTESMKFAPRSNGPLSWEALTKWQIIAAIATPTRSAMRSLVRFVPPMERSA